MELLQAATPSVEELDAYLNMTKEELIRLVLCLLIEDALRNQILSLPPSIGLHAARHFGSENLTA